MRSLLTLLITLLCSGVFSGVALGADSSATHLIIASVPVSDLENSTRFYTDVFELQVAMVIPQDTAIKDALEVILTLDGKFDPATTPGLILIHHDDRPLSPEESRKLHRLLVISTSDLDGMVARAQAAGVATREGSNPNVRFISDPDGYQIELYQP